MLPEIEFPTTGLQTVPGDGEGGNEMTGSMLLIREFCDRFVPAEKVTRTRIFFPEANEVSFARQSAFEGCSLKLDYLGMKTVGNDRKRAKSLSLSYFFSRKRYDIVEN
uniref:Uncharacterized protein n=1 Tax=Arundo donax TaxID=35708 RepID=A0A0A9E2V2_ARUDO